MFLLTLSVLFSLLWTSSVQAASNTLKDIQFATLPGNKVQVTLEMSGPATAPKSFATDKPARISLDFSDTASGLAKKTKAIGIGKARSVTAIEAGGRTRVVISLTNAAPFQTKLDGNKVILTLDSGSEIAQSSRPNAAGGSADGLSLTNVDFRRGDAGEGRVIISLTDPSAVVDISTEGSNVVLNFVEATLPERLQRRLDVTDFATPVKMIDTLPNGDGVKIVISPVGEYEHLAYQAEDKFVVEFKPISKEEKEAQRKKRFTYTGERLSLNFQDIEVRAVLQLLADFTDLNMVTSDSVGGNLTLRLTNVPWDQALDIILKAKGLAMRQTGNVILVAPTEEIAAREKLELEAKNQIDELAPLASEFIPVSYAKAADLAELIKSQENSVLSDRGSVAVDERTNTLIVQDIQERINDIHRLVDKLDIEVRQVMIESRLITAQRDFLKALGARIGGARKVGIDGGDGRGVVGGAATNINNTGAELVGDATSAGNIFSSVAAVTGANAGNLALIFGKAASEILSLELSAASLTTNVDDIASPKVVTLDKHEARIAQGFEVAFQEASASGATTTSFRKAELSLTVTPSITPDDRIIMDIEVTDNNIDAASQALGALTTKEIETTVLVDNGETIVLGGILEIDQQVLIDGVPFFKDLPYVGRLFRNTSTTDKHKELLIFITPRILKAAFRNQ
ncbi:MAG: type IV pilus secretin PilQ [Methylococcales bacterium]|jgi:type IV pilus assembly protein PilQ|nr:type IV pilus secretin PilQ [Methylococcales bacterium]MBT7443560.1 type IV pilus secretin PilQ [Methylococcales bacterium]